MTCRLRYWQIDKFIVSVSYKFLVHILSCKTSIEKCNDGDDIDCPILYPILLFYWMKLSIGTDLLEIKIEFFV